MVILTLSVSNPPKIRALPSLLRRLLQSTTRVARHQPSRCLGNQGVSEPTSRSIIPIPTKIIARMVGSEAMVDEIAGSAQIFAAGTSDDGSHLEHTFDARRRRDSNLRELPLISADSHGSQVVPIIACARPRRIRNRKHHYE